MEKLTKEDFEQWVKDNKWLQIGEAPTPNGRQPTFLTPSGNLIIAMYDLKGNLEKVGQLVPAPMPRGSSPLDFLGGSQHSR